VAPKLGRAAAALIEMPHLMPHPEAMRQLTPPIDEQR
jgi:hypothetical protein